MATNSIFKKGVNLLTLASFLLWNLAAATPEGGSVAQGNAAITQAGSQTTINQTSQNTVINWHGFDTAATESVKFNQPNASSIALNRINSGQPTNFNGSLSANGQVWILNPSGVLFGASSKVDVAGLLVTTHNITDSNFMSGNYLFTLDPNSMNSKIINNGLITVQDSGIVALVGPGVENNGTIIANLGKVYLSSGDAFVLDMYGDSLINFGSSPAVQNGYVSNSGLIQATGGKVHMTANAAAGILDNVISMSGAIVATSVSNGPHGEIILNGGHTAGRVKVSGKLDTSGGQGFIETSGYIVDLEPGVVINAGAGGSWSMDPNDINITPTAGCTNPNVCTSTFTASGGATASNVDVNFIESQLNGGTTVTLNSTGVIKVWNTVGTLTAASPVSGVRFNLFGGTGVIIDAPINLNSNIALNVTATTITLNPSSAAGFNITAGVQIYTGAVTLGGGVSLTAGISGGDNIVFLGTVDSDSLLTPRALTINTASALIFAAPVGSSNPLASLLVDVGVGQLNINTTAITTTGDQTYNTTAYLVAIPNITFTSGGTIWFANTTLSGALVAVASSPSLVDIKGTTIFSGNVGGLGSSFIDNLLVEGTATLAADQIKTNVSQIYQGAVTLSSPSTTVLLDVVNTGAPGVEFDSTVNGPNALILAGNGGNLTIKGDIGSSIPLTSLSFSDPTLTTHIGGLLPTTTVTTAQFQDYGPVTLVGNATFISNSDSITFGGTVDGGFNLIVSAVSGVVKFEQNVGSSPALSSLVVTASGIDINPNVLSYPVLSIITTGDQTYNGNIRLTTTYTVPGTVPSDILQSNSGNVTLNGPVSLLYPGGEISLFINAANNVSINSTISMDPTPTAPGEGGYLDVTAGNSIYINTSTIDVGSAGDANTPVPVLRSLEFHSPVLLQQDLTITTAQWGALVIDSTVNPDPSGGAHSLTINSPVLTTIEGSMGSALHPLTSIDINAEVLRFFSPFSAMDFVTLDHQTYSQSIFNSLFNAIFITSPGVTFTSLNNGLVSIEGGIHAFVGTTVLQINGNAYLQGNTFSNPNFFTDGFSMPITVTGTTVFDNASIASKFGNQLYQGNVTVMDSGASLSTLTTNIEFGGNVNSVTGNNNATLSLSTPFGGYTQFDGVVNVGASTDPLVALNGSDPFVFNGSTFNVNSFTFVPIISITSLGGVVNAGTLVTFPSTIDGFAFGNSGTLTVNGNAVINATVGGLEPLFRLFVSGTTSLGANVNTYGDTEFGGAVTLTTDSTITDTGTGIKFDSTVDSDALGPWSLTLNATVGPVEFQGDVGAALPHLRDLTVTAGNQIKINTLALATLGITTTGVQAYNGTVVLTTSVINPVVTLTSTDVASDITFNGQVTLSSNAQEVQFYVNAGHDINFKSDILLGDTGSFTGGYVNATAGNKIFLGTLGNLATLQVIGGDVDVGFFVLGLDFNSPVVLNQNTLLSAPTIRMNSTIDANAGCSPACTLNTSGVVLEFHGNIGDTGPLGSLTTGIGQNFIDFFGPMTSITTIGDQLYNDVIVSFGVTSLNFTVTNPLNSASFNTSNTRGTPANAVIVAQNFFVPLTVNGNAVFNGDLRYNTPGALIVTGKTQLNGFANGNITISTASQDYQGAVTLGGNVGTTATLSSTGFTTFESTVSGSPSLDVSGNPLEFDGVVNIGGSLTALAPFGSAIILNTSSITTGGSQTYNGAVALAQDVQLNATNSGSQILFQTNALVNGTSATPWTLTANADNLIEFFQPVGADFGQLFTNPINIIATVTNGDIRFDSTVDGGSLTLTVPGGLFVGNTVRFGGSLGATIPLTSIDIVSAGIIDFVSSPIVHTTGNQTYGSSFSGGYANLSTSIAMTSDNANITFDQNILGSASTSMTVVAPNGAVTFNAGLGLFNAFGFPNNLTVTASTININTGNLTTVNDQTYNGPVFINNIGAMTFKGANIIFNSPVESSGTPAQITITGNLVIGNSSSVGIASDVSSLFVSGTTRDGGDIITTNDPTFVGAYFLTNDVTITDLSVVGITFGSTVDNDAVFTGPWNLTLNVSAGTVTFGGDMGTINGALQSLTVNGTSSFSEGSLQTVNTHDSQIYTNTVTLNNDVQLFTLDSGPFGTHLISFGYGAAGVSGPGFSLTAVTNNSANGSMPQGGIGITGTVNVGALTLGGPGGARISSFAVQDSFVGGQGGQQARTNTVISPDFSPTAIYCVNGFNCTPAPTPVTNFPVDVPPTQIFGPPTGLVSCNASGCANLELAVDNLVEAGVVNCAGNGCPYGFVEARDTNGHSRILMQGDVVYIGDTLFKDKNSCVCVKAVSGKRACYGPGKEKIEYGE